MSFSWLVLEFFSPFLPSFCVAASKQVPTSLRSGREKKAPRLVKHHHAIFFFRGESSFQSLIGCSVQLVPWFCWLNSKCEHDGGGDEIMPHCGTSPHFILYPHFSIPLTSRLHDRKETCAWSRMPYVNTVSKSIVPQKGNWRPPCTQAPASSSVDAETVSPGGK